MLIKKLLSWSYYNLINSMAIMTCSISLVSDPSSIWGITECSAHTERWMDDKISPSGFSRLIKYSFSPQEGSKYLNLKTILKHKASDCNYNLFLVCMICFSDYYNLGVPIHANCFLLLLLLRLFFFL